jgi:DnaJ homolog subfamily C member 19
LFSICFNVANHRCFPGIFRERATIDKIKEAHKRVMVANHPDAGGSHYVASTINEAKDMLMGKGKSGASVF